MKYTAIIKPSKIVLHQFIFFPLLSQCHIQRHHDRKPCRKQDGPHIGVLPFRHFRDQFLHDHIDHGSGRKTQKIRKERNHKACRKYGQRRPTGSTAPESVP